jgi:hypothetical protein
MMLLFLAISQWVGAVLLLILAPLALLLILAL